VGHRHSRYWIKQQAGFNDFVQDDHNASIVE
jgi:hypothetical protein